MHRNGTQNRDMLVIFSAHNIEYIQAECEESGVKQKAGQQQRLPILIVV